jgi:hypothetical protein
VSEQKQKWGAGDFSRRSYGVEGADLDKAKRISVVVKMDGEVLMNVQLREPGILAIVSRPDEQGMTLELVEPGGVRFTDYVTPKGDNRALPPTDWQIAALLGEKK